MRRCVNPITTLAYTNGKKMKSKKRKIVTDGRSNTERISVRLTPQQHFELGQHCKKHGLCKSEIVRQLIQIFIDRIDELDEEQG